MASFRWPPTDQQQAVTGPASSTDNALVRWNGTAGTAVRNSPGTSLDDVGNLTVKSVTGSDLTASRLPVIDADKKLVHSAVTATEAGYLSGVTSAIQTQLTTNATAISTETTNRIADVDAEEARALAAESDLQDEIDAEELARASADTTLQTNINAKQDTITGAATTITGANLTTDRALTSNGSGKVAVSAVTSTELGYVSGVTSAIQTQLDAKIAASVLTTRGDLIRRGAAAPERFAAVTDNRVVRGDGTDVVSGQIDDPAFFTNDARVGDSSPGIMPSDLSTLSDIAATRMGMKTYYAGTNYNGGISPTLSGSNSWSTVRGVFRPFQTQDGTWFLWMQVQGTVSSASRTSSTVDINGITTKNVAGYNQALACTSGGSATDSPSAEMGENDNTVVFRHATDTTTRYSFEGTIELNAKPTWAYG
jgi:hypothetical protein